MNLGKMTPLLLLTKIAKYISARILRALKNSYLSKLLLLKPIVNATISRNFCLSNKCGAFFSLKTISRNFFIQFPRRTDDGFEIVDFTIKLCPASDLFRQIVLRYIQLAKFSQNFSPAFFFLVKLLYNSDTKFCYFSFFVVVGGLLKLFILYNLMYQSLLSRNFQCNICSSPLTLLIASVFLRIFLGFVLKVAWEISNLSVETEINGRCSSFIFEIILKGVEIGLSTKK